MKLRYLATVVALALTTVAAHAQTQNQIGLYFNPVATRVGNSVLDSGPFAFLGQNTTSRVFYGFDLGGYYDFFHTGKVDVGFDVRYSDVHANNAMLREILLGPRLSAHPFKRPFKPYIQASIGTGTTKAPASTVEIRKVNYALFGGLDYALQTHIDLRVIEVGYGTLTTVSSATVGNGGTIAIPASSLLSFSTGFVFRF